MESSTQLVLEELTGSRATEFMAGALPAGAELASLEPTQVLYRPDRRVTVSYEAALRWPDGRTSSETLVAQHQPRDKAVGVGAVVVADQEVAIWRAPEDPDLPGLRQALDTAFARKLLASLGIDAVSVHLRTVAYRPRSRAVVEVEADLGVAGRVTLGAGGRLSSRPQKKHLFLKVMDPDDAAAVADTHRALAAVVPVPACHEPAPGIIALEGLPGITLGRALRRGEAVPPGSEVLALTERIAKVALDGEPAPRAGRRLANHAALLRAVLPDAAGRIDRLEEVLEPQLFAPVETTHGDLHEGQILVERGRITGLLDVDDAGPGERIDDVALIAGRVWLLGHDRRVEAIVAYADDLVRAGARSFDASELQRRIGISLLGRVTGPFRNQLADWPQRSLRRLDILERWVAETVAT